MNLIKKVIIIFSLLSGNCVSVQMLDALPASSGKPLGESYEYGKPNVIVILADDIGYGDFGCYGSRKIPTPNVDKLAAEGRLFTNGYSVAASCTPTRYSMLTGEYPWRNPDVQVIAGDAPILIEPGRMTLPVLMQRAGYATGLVGKWHLGLGTKDDPVDFNARIEPGPLEIGFDVAYYFPAAGGWVPTIWIDQYYTVGLDPEDPIVLSMPRQRQSPETNINGITHLGRQEGGTSALFDYTEIADVIVEKSTAFIEANQNDRFFLYVATHDTHVPRLPAERFRGASDAGLRGDSIVSFDWTVGQIVEHLKELGLYENTLILVSSDNGGALSHWLPGAGADGNNGHPFNGHLRGNKGQSFEGGVRVPLIVSWPEQIRPGIGEEIVSLMDLLGTMAALTAQSLELGEGVDSFNVLPEFLGEAEAPARKSLVLEGMPFGHGDRPALRYEHWKLIPSEPGASFFSGGIWRFAGRPWAQLYDLNRGAYEDVNQAAAEPEQLAYLNDVLKQLLDSEQTRP